MSNKVTIEISNDLYQDFLQLKETISLMAKETVSDQDLVGFMVEEISASIDMMAKDGHHHEEGGDCCGGEKHGEEHECCGGGHCGN